ncbi:MAG TPA: DUF1990 domain-containing protein [Myxococcota bacterium]|nr:DUF1990 domain-containing protein [Myxococcota bacterium]
MSFSYPEVGATAELGSPHLRRELSSRRYDVDHHAFALGRGRALYERARAALLAWRQFEIPWLHFHGSGPVASDQVVATSIRIAGVWFVNPCRVVYRELADRDSVAYAYGTLLGHAECGEERFRVSFDAASDEVRYEIAAFSRPALALSRIGYPIARRIQRRFAASSAEALMRAAA